MKESTTLPANTTTTAEPAVQPKPEQGGSGSTKLNRTFAAVPVASGSDGGDALQSLVADLAVRLGIRADQIQVRRDSEAELTVSRRNARGVAQNGVVYLRWETDPTSRSGRL